MDVFPIWWQYFALSVSLVSQISLFLILRNYRLLRYKLNRIYKLYLFLVNDNVIELIDTFYLNVLGVLVIIFVDISDL